MNDFQIILQVKENNIKEGEISHLTAILEQKQTK